MRVPSAGSRLAKGQGFQGSRAPGLQNSKVAGFHDSKVPKLQESKVAGFHGFKAFRVRGSRVPEQKPFAGALAGMPRENSL